MKTYFPLEISKRGNKLHERPIYAKQGKTGNFVTNSCRLEQSLSFRLFIVHVTSS